MKLRLVHRERSDYAAAVRDFIRNLQSGRPLEIEELDPDSTEGAEICRLYGIMQYPAVLVTTDEGILSFISQGTPLPLIREVQYYVR